MLSLVRQVRPDVKVVANDLLTAIEALGPVLLPVTTKGGGTARAGLRKIRDHLEEELEIAGAYRLGVAGELLRDKGWQGLYTHTLFRFDESMRQGLEPGRSFVQTECQNRQSLDYLWYGIGALISRYPGFRYLFGPASISPLYGDDAIARIVYFYSTHYRSERWRFAARRPYRISPEALGKFTGEFNGCDREQDFRALRDRLAERGRPVPTLYKHYTQATWPAGVSFAAFTIDGTFGDCAAGFVIADLEQLKPRKRRGYLGARRKCPNVRH